MLAPVADDWTSCTSRSNRPAVALVTATTLMLSPHFPGLRAETVSTGVAPLDKAAVDATGAPPDPVMRTIQAIAPPLRKNCWTA